jgi:hypothetical protein
MPGFKIAGYGGDAVSTLETLRPHRWRIIQLGPITAKDYLLTAKELTLPQWKAEQLTVLGAVLTYKYAKNVKWDDISVTFYDTKGLAAEIEKWRSLVNTDDKGILVHGSGGYKKECEFEELDGNGDAVRDIKLFGAWPNTINYGKLSYTNSELKSVDLSITYDYAKITPK